MLRFLYWAACVVSRYCFALCFEYCITCARCSLRELSYCLPAFDFDVSSCRCGLLQFSYRAIHVGLISFCSSFGIWHCLRCSFREPSCTAYLLSVFVVLSCRFDYKLPTLNWYCFTLRLECDVACADHFGRCRYNYKLRILLSCPYCADIVLLFILNMILPVLYTSDALLYYLPPSSSLCSAYVHAVRSAEHGCSVRTEAGIFLNESWGGTHLIIFHFGRIVEDALHSCGRFIMTLIRGK